jgi:hypothetical protein
VQCTFPERGQDPLGITFLLCGAGIQTHDLMNVTVELYLTLKSRVLAHAYNPNYSGGRDQEDCSLRPAWANIS